MIADNREPPVQSTHQTYTPTVPGTSIEPAVEVRTRNDNIPPPITNALVKRYVPAKDTGITPVTDVPPKTDLHIGWMRFDPTTCVFAYHDSDGHLHCYASKNGLQKVRKSVKLHSWKLTIADDSKRHIKLIDKLDTNTWFRKVWDFVREESKRGGTAPHLPFRDALDYIRNPDLIVIYQMARDMFIAPNNFNLNSHPRDKRVNDLKRFVSLICQFAACAKRIMDSHLLLPDYEDQIKVAEDDIMAVLGLFIMQMLDARAGNEITHELAAPNRYMDGMT